MDEFSDACGKNFTPENIMPGAQGLPENKYSGKDLLCKYTRRLKVMETIAPQTDLQEQVTMWHKNIHCPIQFFCIKKGFIAYI